MKNLPPSLKTALESEAYIQSILISIDVYSTNFRFTTWSQPIIYNFELYLPRGIKVYNISYSTANIVNNVSLDFDDTDRAIYSTLGNQNAGVFNISIIFAILDELGKIQASLIIFTGNISHWSYAPGIFKISAASIFEQWSQVTTARFSGSCRWKIFKGIECTYSGPGDECDRTYGQCEIYGNEANFGGFRWLPSLVNKKLNT